MRSGESRKMTRQASLHAWQPTARKATEGLGSPVQRPPCCPSGRDRPMAPRR